MEIIIDGWRAGGDERKEAASVPVDRLPPLSEAQKVTARKMGIPEETYARSAYAGMRNQDRLAEKTKKFARLLQEKLQGRHGVQLESIRLDVLQHRYQVVGTEGGQQFSFFVSEEMIDELFQTGSGNLERNLERVLELALPAQRV
jgi:hypothetical protein